MSIQNITIHDVRLDDSRFSLRGFLFEPSFEQSCHIDTFCSLGILYPVIVYRDEKGLLHLIDGKKRAEYAIQRGERMIPATVLAESTPVTDIITLMLCNKRNEIESSVMNKIQFLCFAISLNVPESWILQMLCVPFEFKPHSEFLRECERIGGLPLHLRRFCHEKKFSLKQLVNFSYYPADVLNRLVEWRAALQMTASAFDEIASHLRDYLKTSGKNMEDFLVEPEVEDIFESSLSPRDKTEKLRQLLHLKRFPTLSQVNAGIRGIVEQLHLPRGIKIDWDNTLENKNLDVTVSVNDPGNWQAVLDALNSREVKKAIHDILDEL